MSGRTSASTSSALAGLLARLPQLAHARGQRPQAGAVVLQRFERRGRQLSRQRVRADRGGDETGRVGQRLVEQLASQADRIADVESIPRPAGRGRARCPTARSRGRGARRRGCPTARRRAELVAQLAQVGPARLQRQRVAQGLVGPLGLQRAAVLGQDLAQRPPGQRVGRGEVDRDLRDRAPPRRPGRRPRARAPAAPARATRSGSAGPAPRRWPARRPRARCRARAPPRRPGRRRRARSRAAASPRARARDRRARSPRADRARACAARATAAVRRRWRAAA